jgi:molecular chaperone GrpE
MDHKKNNTESSEPVEAAGPGPADTVDLADSAALLTSITAERDQLARERSDLYDQLLRRTAEFDNFRRRTQKERSDYVQYAGMEAVGELLPVLDDFERALKIETADRAYAEGMQLIYNRLLETLKKLGLEEMAVEGQPFDPHMHHAVEMVATADVDDHTVLQELRRGYNFKGKLLRPAMVKVAVQP